MTSRCLLAALFLTGGVAKAEDPSLPIPAVERQRIDNAGTVGKLIYDYDRAAWVATDDFLAKIPADQRTYRGGWLVEPRADGSLVVTFYGDRGGPAFVRFVAVWRDGKIIEDRVVAEGDHVALTPVEARMVTAKQIASGRLGGSGHNPCAPAAFNSVELVPAGVDDPISLYFLTPQLRANSYPAGGHFRIDVDKAGTTSVDRAFTNTCIELSSAPGPNGAPVAAFITHLLDPTPTGIHVWLSLSMKLPLIVGTADRRNWKVDGSRITLLALDIDKMGEK